MDNKAREEITRQSFLERQRKNQEAHEKMEGRLEDIGFHMNRRRGENEPLTSQVMGRLEQEANQARQEYQDAWDRNMRNHEETMTRMGYKETDTGYIDIYTGKKV